MLWWRRKPYAELVWAEKTLLLTLGMLIGASCAARQEAMRAVYSWDWSQSTTAPQPGKLPDREPADSGAVPRSMTLVGVTMFDNASDAVTEDDRANLRRWARALAKCRGLEATLIGTTSSAPFAPSSTRTNVALARDRAQAVAALLARYGVAVSVATAPGSEADLDARRLINDRAGRALDPDIAAIARRVDLSITALGSCEQGGR